MLIRAGVKSPSELRTLGSARAFVRVREAGLRPSLNLLWALEGAIRDIPWQQVARTDRLRLLMELEDVLRPVRPAEV
jgi:DNA transformation protein